MDDERAMTLLASARAISDQRALELEEMRAKLERTVGYWNDTRAERGEYLARAEAAERALAATDEALDVERDQHGETHARAEAAERLVDALLETEKRLEHERDEARARFEDACNDYMRTDNKLRAAEQDAARLAEGAGRLLLCTGRDSPDYPSCRELLERALAAHEERVRGGGA